VLRREIGDGDLPEAGEEPSESDAIGPSVEQIDRTYGHLLPDAADHERSLLDAFDNLHTSEAAEAGERRR
jgi:hypothetical protein